MAIAMLEAMGALTRTDGFGARRLRHWLLLSFLTLNSDNIDAETHLGTQTPNLDAPWDKTVAVVKFESPGRGDGQSW